MKKDVRSITREIERLYTKFDRWTFKEIIDTHVPRFEKTVDDTLSLLSLKEVKDKLAVDPEYISENLKETYGIFDLERHSKFATDLAPSAGLVFGVS